MVSFDEAADEYDAGRPGYPAGVFDALEPLANRFTLEGGAGTGIATRLLLERGAEVVAFDVGPAMLQRARAHTADLAAVVADGAVLPFRSECSDLICFAQSWHWLDRERRCPEAARVLRADGRWAAWWSHPRADDEPWLDSHWTLIERACPGAHREHRDIDWGSTVADSGLFQVSDRVAVPWEREVSVDDWITEQASHSYVIELPARQREVLLADLRDVVERAFPPGTMRISYETRLWIAHKR